MRAKTQLHVEDGMMLSVTLEMNVSEIKTLMTNLDANTAWPIAQLKSVLAQSLRKATDSYYSEHELSA